MIERVFAVVSLPAPRRVEPSSTRRFSVFFAGGSVSLSRSSSNMVFGFCLAAAGSCSLARAFETSFLIFLTQ